MQKTIKITLCLALLLTLSITAFAYEKAYVSCDVLNVRVSPNTDCQVIKQITTNTPVDIIYTTDTGWCSVLFEDNTTGFVCATYLRMANSTSSSATGDAIAQEAHNYLGYKYVYGTAGPNTFDCSGFTSYLYKKYGYSLPRVSSSQATVGSVIAKSELKKGDLVFFSNSSTSKIGHVGIYVGDGEFIHASTSTRGVVKDKLSSDYYTKHYITARRIV
ncbi:MAG: C40 family peptidase [Clostridia bacterium]|nr:C40 family peptidase [Clostridia bacterium]